MQLIKQYTFPKKLEKANKNYVFVDKTCSVILSGSPLINKCLVQITSCSIFERRFVFLKADVFKFSKNVLLLLIHILGNFFSWTYHVFHINYSDLLVDKHTTRGLFAEWLLTFFLFGWFLLLAFFEFNEDERCAF